MLPQSLPEWFWLPDTFHPERWEVFVGRQCSAMRNRKLCHLREYIQRVSKLSSSHVSERGLVTQLM